MNRVPKPPIGFVPVDSEEARGIDDEARVNSARIADGSWIYEHAQMKTVRNMRALWPDDKHHVQLPPAVEWEEVWGWGVGVDAYLLFYNGVEVGRLLQYSDMDKMIFTADHIRAIVRALNEMEGR